MMKIPHPDDLPPAARKIGRLLFGPQRRKAIATKLQALAEWQWRLDRNYRQNRLKLLRLANRHRGETCIIVGNGPSIRGFDLSRLSGASTFCLNRGYLLWQAQGLEPDYYVAVNELVVEQFHDEIAGLTVPKIVPWKCSPLFGHDNSLMFVPIHWDGRFYKDISRGVWTGATVTFAALQIAYHMGFVKVILIGVDHSFSFDGQPNETLLSKEADPNHFDPDYFGAGVKWQAPDLAQSERSFALARQVYEADNRTIIDATEGGKLTVFEKCTLEEALG